MRNKLMGLAAAATVGGLALATVLTAPMAGAQSAATFADLPNGAPDIAVTAVKSHLTQLQSIATANGGNRAAGRAGYQASVSYVQTQLQNAGYTVTVQPFTSTSGQTWNVLAELTGSNPNQVVQVGAAPRQRHRRSGHQRQRHRQLAALLAVALAFKQARPVPQKTIRFSWWGAEELGLVGSKYYVNNLPATERAKITAYLNFDMIGSPNPGYFVYDDDPALQALIVKLPAEPRRTSEPRPRATVVPTTRRSRRPASRSAASSPARAGSRPPPRSPSGAAPSGVAFDRCYHAACDTTATSTTPRSTATATRSRSPSGT